MSEPDEVTVRLNQQQLELIDGTVERLGAQNRAEILLRSLEEFHREQRP